MGKVNEWEQAEPGVKRKIFNPGETIMMMEVRFEEGAEGYLHSHPHEQLSYCLEGQFEFVVNGETTILSQGETIFIPSGAEHGCRALKPSRLLDSFTPLRLDLLGRN
ncbi:quercetin dioxygenase-like cupin family protein [Paenibacillus phyllosphaerae]|uniref:Quercetin dioxygenase-like cupin family protein n=1 Tax=Paenibacillus phyllosphaerae TaxID=274593 RepID=A0A7W5AZ80_9BACL|nr:cupin domain-containing protein [Paenibacillus phyllosphaerae]MBB3111485.1 quercetin dioxygenase-like cupin family protein [Paenibacillus phyllosphaerae]